MAYSKPTEVNAYYLGLDFDNSDFIISGRVKKWLAEEAAKMDMQLRRKYALPITNENDLLVLKVINEEFVVGKIDEIIRLNSDDENEKKYIRNRNAKKDAEKKLMGLLDGSLVLETSPKNLAPIKFIKGATDE